MTLCILGNLDQVVKHMASSEYVRLEPDTHTVRVTASDKLKIIRTWVDAAVLSDGWEIGFRAKHLKALKPFHEVALSVDSDTVRFETEDQVVLTAPIIGVPGYDHLFDDRPTWLFLPSAPLEHVAAKAVRHHDISFEMDNGVRVTSADFREYLVSFHYDDFDTFKVDARRLLDVLRKTDTDTVGLAPSGNTVLIQAGDIEYILRSDDNAC